MRRSAKLGLTFFLIAVAIAILGCWMLLRASLPRYDGVVRSGALSAEVDVERDALGTATIRAQNRDDLTWVLGYVHAQERFFQMDLLRRRAAGELAELFGPVALKADRTARAHRMRARAAAAFAALPDDQRHTIERYRDGVNAGLAALGVRPFPYLLTRNDPAPWRDEDSLLVIAAMAFTLNDAENRRELELSRMHAALPASVYRFLTASGGSWDAPIAGPPLVWPAIPPQADFDMRKPGAGNKSAPPSTDADTPGSNSFAVAGALTGGAALLANDMHLDLGVPGLWFRARLMYPSPRRPGHDVDVIGASLPGTPAIIAGSNRQVAWGFTNAYVDNVDWVRVQRDPTQAGNYLAAAGSRPLVKHEEVIHVHGAPDETLTVEDTEWGPILAKDGDGSELALAWTAQQAGALDLGLQKLELAETVDEAVAIAQHAGIPPQNFLAGDRMGNIAWTLAGRLVRREGNFDPSLPADWSHEANGWAGWLDADEYPLVSNPPWQRLWTANQRTAQEPALSRLGDGGYDLGARARQIRDDLHARKHFTPEDMLAIQLDDRALFLQHWKDLLQLELHRSPKSALHDRVEVALGDWNGHAAVDSVGYRIVRAWREDVVDTVLDGFAAEVRTRYKDFALPKLPQAEQAVWALLNARPQYLLPSAYADWDALLVSCLDRVAAKIDAQPGGLESRTWGERNTTHIAHPLSRALPAFVARWLDMPREALPGDKNMPRVQSPTFGASERFAVAPGDEEHGYFMLAGGQSGHPLSPYYGAGHADWAAGRPTSFMPGPARDVLTFQPGP